MAYTLIGGTAAGTVMILLFLAALYAVWFRIKPPKAVGEEKSVEHLAQPTALVLAAE